MLLYWKYEDYSFVKWGGEIKNIEIPKINPSLIDRLFYHPPWQGNW